MTLVSRFEIIRCCLIGTILIQLSIATTAESTTVCFHSSGCFNPYNSCECKTASAYEGNRKSTLSGRDCVGKYVNVVNAKGTDINGTSANGTNANGTDINGTSANGTDVNRHEVTKTLVIGSDLCRNPTNETIGPWCYTNETRDEESKEACFKTCNVWIKFCPSSFTVGQYGCYKYIGGLAYAAGEQMCNLISNHAILPVILNSTVRDDIHEHGYHGMHINLKDENHEGNFQVEHPPGHFCSQTWVPWAPAEPNNANYNENCAILYKQNSALDKYAADSNCRLIRPTVCMIPFFNACESPSNPPKNNCLKNEMKLYIGTKYTTRTGRVCQKWMEQTPHTHNYFNWQDLDLENNYCRNPYFDSGGPWCFTTDQEKRWDYCFSRCDINTLANGCASKQFIFGYDGLKAKSSQNKFCLFDTNILTHLCTNRNNRTAGPWCIVDSSGYGKYCFGNELEPRCVLECIHSSGCFNPTENPECYTPSAYAGDKQVTLSGKACVADENGIDVCRNPTSDTRGPWCYTNEESKEACFNTCNVWIKMCPASFTVGQYGCYKYIGQHEYVAGEQKCNDESELAIMPIFHNSSVLDEIHQFGYNRTFLNLRDAHEAGNFQVEHPSGHFCNATWIPWRPGQPDNYGNGEHCITLLNESTAEGDKYVIDDNCTDELPVLCQIPFFDVCPIQ